MKKWLFISAVLMTLALAACVDTPEYPPKPHIEMQSISRTNVAQGDSVFIVLYFEDGDGDLGNPNGNIPPDCNANFCDVSSDSSCIFDPAFSLFFIDERDGCMSPSPFALPYVELERDISGTIEVTIPGICCKLPGQIPCFSTPSPQVDSATFQIFIRDQAGNFSDTITTPPILVQCGG